MGGDDETKKTPPPKVLVRGGGVPIEYPMLNHENYGLCAIRMKIIMQSLCVWEAVDGSASDDKEKDHGAMAVIFQAVLDEVKMAIAEKEPAKEAWEAIKKMSIGEDRVKKVRAQVMKKKFDQLKKRKSHPVSRRRRNGKHSFLFREGRKNSEGEEEGTESTRSSFEKENLLYARAMVTARDAFMKVRLFALRMYMGPQTFVWCAVGANVAKLMVVARGYCEIYGTVFLCVGCRSILNCMICHLGSSFVRGDVDERAVETSINVEGIEVELASVRPSRNIEIVDIAQGVDVDEVLVDMSSNFLEAKKKRTGDGPRRVKKETQLA